MANLNESFHHAIIKAYDAATESLKTTITNASIAIDVSAIADSIAIADDSGNKVTTTLIGSKRGLDVNVADITLNKSNDSVSTESFDQSTRIDEASSSVSYFGFAEVGSSEASSVWKIKKMSTSGAAVDVFLGVSTSSTASSFADLAYGQNQIQSSMNAQYEGLGLCLLDYEVNVTSTTTYYLKAKVSGTGGTPVWSYYKISARRVQ